MFEALKIILESPSLIPITLNAETCHSMEQSKEEERIFWLIPVAFLHNNFLLIVQWRTDHNKYR